MEIWIHCRGGRKSEVLRKCTCGLEWIVEDYKHRYERNDEWRMGIATV